MHLDYSGWNRVLFCFLLKPLIYDLFSKKGKFLWGSAWQRSEWLKDELMCKIKLKHKSRQKYRNKWYFIQSY